MAIKPIYENKKAPCFSQDFLGQNGCPAINDIPGFLYAVSQKNFHLAFQILKKTNPFSGGCGRFCDHPCEAACNRGKMDAPVNIRSIERFVSDFGHENRIYPDPVPNHQNQSVAIIGGGPAGLTAAYFLKQNGFSVDVYERESLAGGMMAQGIPVFRYPTEILKYELECIQRLGVNILGNSPVDTKKLEQLTAKYDYTLIATGAHKPRRLNIPGEEHPSVVVGLDFLKRFNLNNDFRNTLDISKTKIDFLKKEDRVAVIGGGYTAVDVARSAARLGLRVSVYYRRSESDLNIHPGEVSECIKEGIDFHFYLNPYEITPVSGSTSEKSPGKIKLTLERMITGEIGADGKSTIIPGGEFIETTVDAVIKAIGETPDLKFLPSDYAIKGNRVEWSGAKNPVFIAGDARYGYARDVGMVVRAIGSGRITASDIIELATGKRPTYYGEEKIAYYSTIKTRYFKPQSRSRIHALRPNQRKDNFQELTRPLDPHEAAVTASRCFFCGICIQCDWCFHYSHGAILKHDTPWDGSRENRYYSFLDEKVSLATRNSVEACPRNAMGMADLSKKNGNDGKHQETGLKNQYISLASLSNAGQPDREESATKTKDELVN